MPEQNNISLTPEVIQMLVSSVTDQGHAHLSEIEAERLLNALTRAMSQTPTGPKPAESSKEE